MPSQPEPPRTLHKRQVSFSEVVRQCLAVVEEEEVDDSSPAHAATSNFVEDVAEDTHTRVVARIAMLRE